MTGRAEDAVRDLSGLTVTELTALALQWTEDEQEVWTSVCELQARGTEEVFAAASALLHESDPRKRAVGVDILAQLGFRESPTASERPFHSQTVALLLGLLESEADPEVLASIATGFGHLGDVRAIPPLVKLARHPSEHVREGVAFGLGGHSDRRAVRALTRLTRDNCPDVRDWATFSLGQLIDNNTREIRDALFDRVSDPDCGVRAEAILGLAVRGDQRIVEPLIGELKGSDMVDGYHNYCGSQIIEAAAQLADPRLYPHLVSLRGTYPEDNLEEAIESCRPPVSQA